MGVLGLGQGLTGLVFADEQVALVVIVLGQPGAVEAENGYMDMADGEEFGAPGGFGVLGTILSEEFPGEIKEGGLPGRVVGPGSRCGNQLVRLGHIGE